MTMKYKLLTTALMCAAISCVPAVAEEDKSLEQLELELKIMKKKATMAKIEKPVQPVQQVTSTGNKTIMLDISTVVSQATTKLAPESLTKKADDFIKKLKEDYPHLTEVQLDVIRIGYENKTLEKQAAQAAKKDSSSTPSQNQEISSELYFSTIPKQEKDSLQARLQNVVHLATTTTGSKKDQKHRDRVKEAGITIIMLTIKRGDTLSDIAQREYGNPAMYTKIYEVNKHQLQSPNVIPEGIVLKIPRAEKI